MNVIPGNNFNSSVSTSQDTLHQSNAVPSLPDTLRQQNGGAVPLSSQIGNRHPLQDRINNWETTQRERQLEQYRQIFGIAEPMKRVMEVEIIEKSGFNPIHSNGNSLHKDILLNKDTSIDWEDVYTTDASGNMASTDVAKDIHTLMENDLKL